MTTATFPKDVLFQTALGLLRAGEVPLIPSELADGIWWVDVQLWGARAYGLTLERWHLTERGLDLASLASLRQGRLPDAWAPWLTFDTCGIIPNSESQRHALDELSPRIGAYIAAAVSAGPERWSMDRETWSDQARARSQETPLAVEAILELTRHPEADWPHLAAAYAEQVALAKAFQTSTSRATAPHGDEPGAMA